MARPSIFTQEIADDICKRLSLGQSLKRMCEECDHLPHRDTVNDWMISKPGFSDRIVRAREIGAHAIVEEARDIADDGTNDYMEKLGRDGQPIGYVMNGEWVARSRLRIDQRWREAEAHLSKVYGRKQQVEHSGVIGVANVSSDELMAELLAMAASGRLKLPDGAQLIETDDEPEDDEPEDDFSDLV